MDVAVGAGVSVAGCGVAVGGMGVTVGAGVSVAGCGVAVGGMGVTVGAGVSVAGCDVISDDTASVVGVVWQAVAASTRIIINKNIGNSLFADIMF
jgi:hypothetical protein